MNPSYLLPYFCELLVKSLAVLLLAGTIVHLWRGSSAAQRHFVWLAAMAVLLLLPATRLWTPRWQVPIERAVRIQVSDAARPRPIPVAVTSTERSAPQAPGAAWKFPEWPRVVIATWLTVAGGLLGYRLLGSWRLRRLEVNGLLVGDARIVGLTQVILRDLKIKRPVTLRISRECRVPMTWGIRRPVLVLPFAAREWPEARVMAAVRHEAGHISRRDYLVRWFAHLACALYWPNPLVWMATRSLRIAQEQATDDLVLQAGTPPQEYATQLFEAARTVAAHGLFARHAVAMATPSTLESRVLAIVDDRRNRRPLSRRTAIIGTMAIALSLAVCTAAQLRAEEAKAEGPAIVADSPETSKQVRIHIRIFEASPNASETESWLPSREKGILNESQLQGILGSIRQRVDVDSLYELTVTAKSRQPAMIGSTRTFRYPTEWEKEAGRWTPISFDTKEVGLTIDVHAEVKTDGSLVLKLKPSVVGFLGFDDLDDRKSSPAPTLASDGGGAPENPNKPESPAGQRTKPVFSERRMDTGVTLKSGETVILADFKEEGEVKPFASFAPKRKLVALVTVSTVSEAEKPAAAAAAKPGPATPTIATAAERAATIVIPKIDLREATVADALAMLSRKSRELDPEGRGVEIVLKAPVDPSAKITISLTSIPLHEALRYIGSLAGLEVVAEPGALILQIAPGNSRTEPIIPLARSAPVPRPYGIWIKNKPGFVISPFKLEGGITDVRGFKPGTEVICPYTRNIFLVPEPIPAEDSKTLVESPDKKMIQEAPKESRIEGRAGVEIRQSNPALNRGPLNRRPGEN